MTDIREKLKEAAASGSCDGALAADAAHEIAELREKCDALEEILIVLVRTPLPWDEEGDESEKLPHFKERYQNAMREASRLLGLDVRSTITRTEPKT